MPLHGGDYPQIGDTDDAIVELLRIIAQNTGGFGHEVHEGDVTIEQGLSDGQIGYATSGPTGMVITEDWDDLSLGITARVVSFRRFEIPIHVAFLNPEERSTWIIPLDPDENESPFVIGDAAGLNATRIWVRADPTVDYDELEETPSVHFIAYQ